MRYTAGGRRLLREMQKYHFCRSRPPVLRDAGKRRLMKDEQEKSAADLLDCDGIYLSGTGHLRSRSADSAYGAFLNGNRVLLHEKLEKAS